MHSEGLIKIAEAWFAAFNKQDLDGLLSLYAEDAKHYSPKLKIRQPETKGFIKGKNALRAWWQNSFERLPSLRYVVVRLTPFEDRIFMEYKRFVVGEEAMLVGETLAIKNDLIVASRVYHS